VYWTYATHGPTFVFLGPLALFLQRGPASVVIAIYLRAAAGHPDHRLLLAEVPESTLRPAIHWAPPRLSVAAPGTPAAGRGV